MTPDPRIARTRERVLAAAWELLNEVGFEGITVELVSERSGVARSTLYRHWRTMPEILRDAFADQAARSRPSATSPDDTAGASRDGGLRALTAYAEAVAVGLNEVWGRAAASLAGSALGDPDQKAVQTIFVDGTHRDLTDIVRIGRSTGELDEGADESALVGHLIDHVIAPMFYRYMFTDEPVTPRRAVELAEAAWPPGPARH